MVPRSIGPASAIVDRKDRIADLGRQCVFLPQCAGYQFEGEFPSCTGLPAVIDTVAQARYRCDQACGNQAVERTLQ